MTRTEQAEQRAFYRGFISALAALVSYKEDSIYDYVVSTINDKELMWQASKDGSLRWSGLAQYRRRALESR
ncbi:hypothetical protein LCGC14_1144230 [marine sediment metagenome]|uniref:Uncharacterized protein n=1 Tax=marine sediment metagenome TaxID=412755 RepID=A0A0F9MKH3_9ZZZZ